MKGSKNDPLEVNLNSLHFDNSTESCNENFSPPEFPNLPPRYPQRSNKGIPKKQYEPELKANTKYPISNYVSNHRLSESCALTVNQLSNVSIPSSVHDAVVQSV